MSNITTKRQRVWLRRARLAAAVVVVMVLGGCSLVLPKPHSSGSSNPFDDSAHPMNDDQTKAQLIEPAKQIVTAADLQGVSGAFSFASCNDQGDPPYQGTVTISFLIHGEPDTYFQQVRAAMLSHGWNEGAPPGQHYHGTTLNKNGVTANINFFPSDHAYGEIILDGECRNTANHKGDGRWIEITNQITAP
ncbi:hypothetical protein [Mycobacterium angelicum]|uniref:Lipoprotein LppJ n=1 Tax=Mycobacterium angelicum TaxID=470074 RepID=A0A1W9ZLT6_MYCAN|nr:hypothetical protein [Mycobacterium angelicum]MCV7196031.1 hypothetical protein [Mycobacterium angelicum]ORA18421.1 hypothetical protein BST12_18830 [Mycobacterium angelicum]